jgi:hypothetical protein
MGVCVQSEREVEKKSEKAFNIASPEMFYSQAQCLE